MEKSTLTAESLKNPWVFGGSAEQSSKNYGFLQCFRGGSAEQWPPTDLEPTSNRLPKNSALGAGKMADFRKMMQKPMGFLHLFSLGCGPPGGLKIDEVNSAGQFSETMAV